MHYSPGGQPQSHEARFLVSALLLSVAKGNGVITTQESQTMVNLLSSHLGIDSSEALDDLSSMVSALAHDSNISQTLQEIGNRLSAQEKTEIFTMMLEVAGVDGKADIGELEAISAASRLLDMSSEAVHQAYREYFSTHEIQ
jgi:uncharacterized tellurite resistance protein B-like protein